MRMRSAVECSLQTERYTHARNNQPAGDRFLRFQGPGTTDTSPREVQDGASVWILQRVNFSTNLDMFGEKYVKLYSFRKSDH